MATLSRTGRILMFDDTPSNRNPSRKHADWVLNVQALPVLVPQGPRDYVLAPGEEVTLFAGARALTPDGSTGYALTLSPLDSSRYRLTWTGAGADPTFRTARTVAASGGNLVFALQPNMTVLVTSSLGSIFGAVVTGDDVLVPGVATGDSALFNPLNEGEWTVLAASGAQLTLARKPGAAASGASETVAVTAATQFLAFSATGVQAGDRLDLTAGFYASSLRAYPVVAASSLWVEFTSTLPLADQTVVPGASALSVYSSAKRYVYLESDQEIAVKLNGNTGENDRVEPILPGDPDSRGWFEKLGTVYSLVVKNRSTATANIMMISAE
jgi:hypothetical protein